MSMINKKVLVSGVEFFSDEKAINPYYGVDAIDLEKAKAEHKSIVEAYREAGIEVIQVKPPENCQDGVYAANWALCRGEKCLLSALPGPRKAEEDYAAEILAGLQKTVVRLPEGMKFSGQGDSLPCGRFLLAGSGYRSDPEAQKIAAELFGLELVQLHTIPVLDENGQPKINEVSGWADSLFYDIDLAISVLGEDLIAYCPEAFDEKSQQKIANLPMDKIEVSYDEAVNGLGCNLVSTGETVIMSANAPRMRADIEKHGLKVIPISAPELAKGGGYIRCISLTLD